MWKRVGLLMLAGASVAMGETAAVAVKVSPAEITETRKETLIKKENFFSSDRAGLMLKLHVEGALLAGATKYGKIKIDSASDDAGTALTLEKNGFHANDEMRDISRFGRSEQDAAAGFDLEVNLSLPARKAAKLVEVKGSFDALAGGEEKIVSVDKLPTLAGKVVNDPALKSAGLTMTIVKVDADKREIQVDYAGKTDVLQEVDVLDGNGKKINGGQMMMNLGAKMQTTYDVNHAIDAGVTLKVHLMVGQKSVTVPFDLKDVKLP